MDIKAMPTMSIGEVIDFKIDRELRNKCEYGKDTFEIQKTLKPIGARFDVTGIGYILCQEGALRWLEFVQNIANCGLETHLARLCFSDIGLNPNILGAVETTANRNEAIRYFKKSQKWLPAIEERVPWITENCANFWLIHQQDCFIWRDPTFCGTTFLEAALYQGFKKMIVVDFREEKLHPENGGAGSTLVWQDSFKTNTNTDITDDVDGKWTNDKTDWYFCK